MAISFLAFWLGLDHEIYFAAITHTSPRADKPDTLGVPPRLSRRHRRSRPCPGPVERRDHRRRLFLGSWDGVPEADPDRGLKALRVFRRCRQVKGCRHSAVYACTISRSADHLSVNLVVESAASWGHRRRRVGIVHASAYPGGDALGCLSGGELAGVAAGLDVRPQPGGEPLVLGDCLLGGGAAPGGPAAEPVSENGVGAVEG